MQFSDCNVSDNFAFLTTTMKAQDLLQYFPQLTDIQRERFELLGELYQDWNQKINVVSRKDIEELYLRHVLHSLAIGLFQEFKPGSKIIDVGTGGGFPGAGVHQGGRRLRYPLLRRRRESHCRHAAQGG